MQIVDWLNVIYLMFFFVKFVMHVMNYNIHYYNINANCVKLTGYRYLSDKNECKKLTKDVHTESPMPGYFFLDFTYF